MKQVVQNFRTGELAVADVPAPTLKGGGVLVQTISSAVSAGTEKSKVELAQKSLLGKAMARPDQVRKVIDTLRKEGVRNTYNKVRNKLDALAPLGYSAAGRVVAVPDDTAGFAVGDHVACAGAGYANHAEMMWVPSNLCAPIPSGVSFDDAAFTTIGAIALQGVRQAEVSLGETVVVIGLGLLGQLTVQLLNASGCRAIGVDVAAWKIDLAKAHGAHAMLRSDDVVEQTMAMTNGRGADSIIITAATDNNDPFVLAGDVARDKAKVVLVGAVPIDVPRSPYYEKELDIRLSRSYGPGRYDRAYEESGIDYPIGYVRWTENRNMRAFLDAVAAKKVVLDKLITHRFDFANAHAAYDLIAGTEPFLGVVLKYADRPVVTPVAASMPAKGNASFGFIGAGSFAGGTLIPALRDLGASFRKVCTSSGLTAADAAKRHGFMAAVSGADEVIGDPAINAVVIATRHDSHADLATRALVAGKAVFVEKPLALTRPQLASVMAAARKNPALTVGFNRRFSPHTAQVRSVFDRRGPLVVTIRVNAGPIPHDSWIHDPASGGGRLLGEGCHFVDLAQHLVDARIKRVFASHQGALRDNFVIHLDFEGGSLATIIYTAKGDPSSGKERIEVFGAGMSAVIDDFSTTTIVRGRRSETSKAKVDKGHREEMARFVRMVTSGGKAPIDLDALEMTSLATIAAVESLELGLPVDL